MKLTDATHDPALRSWVESANDAATDFPIQNLPYGRFRRRSGEEPWRIGVAIGDQILDLKAAAQLCPWASEVTPLLQPLAAGDLNAFMALGPQAWTTMRRALSAALRDGSNQGPFLEMCLVPQRDAALSLPCRISEYTDFYTGVHHATTVGKLFRPDNPLLPNYKWVPIGYHGRTSTIGVSGQAFHRPMGQIRAAEGTPPVFAPCKRLDYELELGVLVGQGNPMGERLSMDQAEAQWFGLVLLNDWSARDVQAWEYQPLGPFLAKNFATTISPWVITRDALAPFRRPFAHPEGDPQPLPHLDSEFNRTAGAIDISLQVALQTQAMHDAKVPPQPLMQSSFTDAYWTVAQMLAHHASGGCLMQTADLLGTGTQSGPQPGQGGSLLELSAGGRQPISLPGGEQRTFLEDGDRVILRGHCEAAGVRRIGFGECVGQVLPALA